MLTPRQLQRSLGVSDRDLARNSSVPLSFVDVLDVPPVRLPTVGTNNQQRWSRLVVCLVYEGAVRFGGWTLVGDRLRRADGASVGLSPAHTGVWAQIGAQVPKRFPFSDDSFHAQRLAWCTALLWVEQAAPLATARA